MINEDGVITVFGVNTNRVLNEVTNSFGSSSEAATKFANYVGEACTNIADSIGDESTGFTKKMADSLKYPWTQVIEEDGPITTFSQEVGKNLDNAIDYAQNNYQSIMQNILEDPFKSADLSTFNKKVQEELNKAIAAKRAAEAEINNIKIINTPSYTADYNNGNNGNNSGNALINNPTTIAPVKKYAGSATGYVKIGKDMLVKSAQTDRIYNTPEEAKTAAKSK